MTVEPTHTKCPFCRHPVPVYETVCPNCKTELVARKEVEAPPSPKRAAVMRFIETLRMIGTTINPELVEDFIGELESIGTAEDPHRPPVLQTLDRFVHGAEDGTIPGFLVIMLRKDFSFQNLVHVPDPVLHSLAGHALSQLWFGFNATMYGQAVAQNQQQRPAHRVPPGSGKMHPIRGGKR